jgi:hypothetical protein
MDLDIVSSSVFGLCKVPECEKILSPKREYLLL